MHWLATNNLIDLGFSGPCFTWTRGRSVGTLRSPTQSGSKQLRMEPTIGANLNHPSANNSDHNPLLIKTKREAQAHTQKQFRFQAAWLTHPGFQDLVRSSWHNHIPLNENLMQVRNSLTDWNIEHFSNIFKRENKLWAKIARIQKCLPTQNNPGLLKLEKKLQKELDLTLQQEELLWYQRSREEWIALRDRNTSYYHASTLVRNKRNMIGGLKNRAGEWISDPSQLESMC